MLQNEKKIEWDEPTMHLFNRGKEAINVLRKVGYNKTKIMLESGISRTAFYNIWKWEKFAPSEDIIMKLERAVLQLPPDRLRNLSEINANVQENIASIATLVIEDLVNKGVLKYA